MPCPGKRLRRPNSLGGFRENRTDEYLRHYVLSAQVIKRIFKFRQDLQGRSCKERQEEMDSVWPYTTFWINLGWILTLTTNHSVLGSEGDQPGRQTEDTVLPNRWRSTTALQGASGGRRPIPNGRPKVGQYFLPCSKESEKRTINTSRCRL